MLSFYFIILCVSGLNAVIYDVYTGKPATRRQIEVYGVKNNTQYCLIDVTPCNANEWRRVDGSCNNLKYPSRGMLRTPPIRILPRDFSPDYEPRKAKSGKPLPLARYLRTQLLASGKASDLHMTQLASYYILFALHDVNSIHDSVRVVSMDTACCTPEGKSDYMCTPVEIPLYDPVHRYSGENCQNLTRPQSYQSFGCLEFGTTPFTRISFATPTFDLSNVYNPEENAINNMRTFDKGLLKIDIDHGKAFPPRDTRRSGPCRQNVLPRELYCNIYHSNASLGAHILLILFYRHHNFIAKILAQMNPCWDDDHLFHTAYDINIAIHTQIYFYELLPILLGKRNLIRDGIISPFEGFRDMYNEAIPPEVYDEYAYIKRWFHDIQEMDLKLFDKDGYFVRTFPLTNLTGRTGNLPLDDNIDKYYQSSFRQPSAILDHMFDYDMAERSLGNLQYIHDVGSIDLAKGRYFGFAPYVKYREFCDGLPYKTFDSLRRVMSKERLHRMTEVYDNVEDVELLAGAWAEKPIPGGRVPYTVYCLMVEQLKRSLASDRHWYESPYRPHAFTFEQLQAIRSATIAGMMCAVADGVTKIQPNAFYSISPDNPLTDCKFGDIGLIDLSPWQDPKCMDEVHFEY